MINCAQLLKLHAYYQICQHCKLALWFFAESTKTGMGVLLLMNCNRHYQMVERMSAFQISISSRKLERTPRDPLGTGINEITVKFQNEAPGLIFFRGLF